MNSLPSSHSPLEAALAPVAARVHTRWLLGWAHRWLLASQAGAALIVLGARLAGQPEWPLGALAWTALALAATVVLALQRRPDSWAVACAADRLGLAERVASALHASRVGHPAAPLLVAQATRHLESLDPRAYRIVPDGRRWWPVLLAGVALAATIVLPLPGLEGADRAATEPQLAAARRSVAELRASPPPAPEPVTRRLAAELEGLEEELARARSAAEAAEALEQAQERLATVPNAEDFAWRRALDALAAAWSEQPELRDLARALAAHDAAAVEQSLDELAADAEALDEAGRQRLQLAFQAGANAARDVPGLAGALRQAAARLGAAREGEGEGRSDSGAGRALGDLGAPLAEGARRAAGLDAVQRAVAALGQSRAAVGAPAGGSAGVLAVAGGPLTGRAAGGGGAPGGASGAGSGAGAGGAGSGSGSGQGAGPGPGPGSGAGGAGGAGSGARAGAGAGGGPSPGQPGPGYTGPTGLGGSAAPNTRGATRYDPVYAPSLLGGSGGPQVQAPGDPQGGGGATVEVPDAPLTLGALRPYSEVYGEYEAAARQSLARQSLPPALQGLVQRYFSAIEPGQE